MGRCTFRDTGYGMTEGEALKDAVQSANDEYGHQEGYSGHINSRDYDYPLKAQCVTKPKPAKTCKVSKSVQKGTRKWVTKYFLYNWDDKCVGDALTQGDAIKKAKIHALAKNDTVTIEIKKVLEKGCASIATIRPNKSIRGRWIFTGTAKE